MILSILVSLIQSLPGTKLAELSFVLWREITRHNWLGDEILITQVKKIVKNPNTILLHLRSTIAIDVWSI